MIYRATRIAHKTLDVHSVPPADLNISFSEHDASENDMSPSVSEMQNEIFMCVWWPQLYTALSWFIWLGRQSRSKKGLEFKVLCYNQKMDKGQLEWNISNL